MFNPLLMAWKRKTECIASLKTLFPLKLNETFEMPPDKETPGHSFLISAQASIKARPYSLCSSIPVATAKTLGSKIISCGSIPAFWVSNL